MLLLALVVDVVSLPAQEILATPSPVGTTREALVLSGGGSRGLAHAGVLVGLEQTGHDPDMVVGTSMGALIGALYAAGYPPEEIQRQIQAIDWGEMFTPMPLLLGPDRVVRYPLLILDREADPLRFNRGFIPQWRINRVLARLLFDANARSRGDFDRLARRYRALAADLQTGDTVVLAHGDLARAARASMAVPGVFAPVEWEGRFLVDGGIADNLPTDVAREMGATRIIAVDVSRPPAEIVGRTPFEVAGRALDLLQDNAERGEIPPDVLVLPAIPPHEQGIAFPGDPSPFFRIGLEAALRDLRRATIVKGAPRPVPAPPSSFGGLLVEAPNPAFEALARSVFRGIAPGPYDPRRVIAAVDRLYTSGLFEAVWPRVEESGSEAAPNLVIRIEAPPRTSLAGAIGYDTDRGGRAWGALERSAVLFDAPAILTGSLSSHRLEQWAALSARVHLARWPLLSWSAGAFYREVDVRRYAEDALQGDQEVKRVGTWLGTEVRHALSAWMAAAALRAEWIGVEGAERGLTAGPLLRVGAQSAEVPVVGTPTELEAEARWGELTYYRAAARGSYGRRLGELRLAAVGDLAVATSTAPPDVLPALGDRHAVPGFRWGQERGPLRAITGVDAAYPTPLGGYARTRLRVGAAVDDARVLGDAGRRVTGLEAGLFWPTPFGVLNLGWGGNTAGERRFFVDLGAPF